jgi:hypothetical protein
MGEIKSAWEIALEKTEKLGKLSAEELRRQKEEECALVGQVLANKYLGGLDPWQLEVELDKYRGEEKNSISRAVASKLAQAIELGNRERLNKVIGGISHLSQKGTIEEVGSAIEQLFQEYEQVEQKERKEIEESAEGILHQLRISGSAIKAINPKAISLWQQDLNQLAQPYKERLEQLKQKLIDLS